MKIKVDLINESKSHKFLLPFKVCTDETLIQNLLPLPHHNILSLHGMKACGLRRTVVWASYQKHYIIMTFATFTRVEGDVKECWSLTNELSKEMVCHNEAPKSFREVLSLSMCVLAISTQTFHGEHFHQPLTSCIMLSSRSNIIVVALSASWLYITTTSVLRGMTRSLFPLSKWKLSKKHDATYCHINPTKSMKLSECKSQ